MKKLLILGLSVLMMMGTTGCYTVQNQSSAHYTITEGQSITDTYNYVVEEDFKGMKLNVDLKLTKGEVTFELKDPSGEIQWQEKITSEEAFNETKEFEKIVGEWTLVFNSTENLGEGEFKLQFNKL